MAWRAQPPHIFFEFFAILVVNPIPHGSGLPYGFSRWYAGISTSENAKNTALHSRSQMDEERV